MALAGCSDPEVPLEVGPAPDLDLDLSRLFYDRFDALHHYAPGDTLEERHESGRLVLSYDSTANAFRGTLANRGSDPLLEVRIELRLDGSVDRSTTVTLVDVASMQVVEIALHVDDEPFTHWQVLTDVKGLNRIHGHP